jgi:hypothetical protein
MIIYTLYPLIRSGYQVGAIGEIRASPPGKGSGSLMINAVLQIQIKRPVQIAGISKIPVLSRHFCHECHECHACLSGAKA